MVTDAAVVIGITNDWEAVLTDKAIVAESAVGLTCCYTVEELIDRVCPKILRGT